jgi:hypothetical protein
VEGVWAIFVLPRVCVEGGDSSIGIEGQGTVVVTDIVGDSASDECKAQGERAVKHVRIYARFEAGIRTMRRLEALKDLKDLTKTKRIKRRK